VAPEDKVSVTPVISYSPLLRLSQLEAPVFASAEMAKVGVSSVRVKVLTSEQPKSTPLLSVTTTV